MPAVATNDSVIQFPAPTPADWSTITHLGVHRAQTGTANFLGGSALDTARATSIGADVEVPAGDMTLTFPNGEWSNYGVEQAMIGALGSTSVWVSLHTSDPGLTGAGEVVGNAYARVEVAVTAITVTTS